MVNCKKITVLIILTIITNITNAKSVPVFVATAKKIEIVDEIEALGTLKANEFVDISATVTETITKINFDDGKRVNKGETIIEMDYTEELALKLEEESILLEAEKQVARLEPLVQRGAAPKALLDEQRLEQETAKARIQAIETKISQRKITAPFSGVLGQRNISVGALVQPGTLITTLDDDSKMKMDFSVPEVFLASLNIGADIKATTSAWPNKIFLGKIQSIDSRVSPTTRAILVRAIIDNPDYSLKPGLLMRVKVNNNPRLAIIIPEEAIVHQGEDSYIYSVENKNNKQYAKIIKVTVGVRQNGNVEILSGLEAGVNVVIHGTLRIRDGSEIDIVIPDKDNINLINNT